MVKKKHILFIVENSTVPMDPRVSKEALTLRDNGYDISVIAPKKGKYTKSYEVYCGIDIYRHPMPHEASHKSGFIIEYGNALFWEIYLSIKLFFKKPFQFIHAANPPDTIFIIACFFRMLGVKFVFDHHDICPEAYLAKFERKDTFYYLQLLLERISLKTADVVISTNESYKKIAVLRGNKKNEHVFVVRNGPDLSSVNFVSPNERLKSGFKYLVAYVGVIGKQEGIENLLQTAQYLINGKGISYIKFTIVGTGPHWHQMVALSRRMNLNGHVEFTGFIPYREFYEVLATADICINPEFRNDFTDRSTMLKIMDYMVFRKPIIQFKTIEGEVTAGESSLYIERNCVREFGEAILELLHNKLKREEMGEAGWKRICEKLTWQKQKQNLIAAYSFMENSK